MHTDEMHNFDTKKSCNRLTEWIAEVRINTKRGKPKNIFSDNDYLIKIFPLKLKNFVKIIEPLMKHSSVVL